MAGIVTISPRTTVSSMYEDYFFTMSRLRAHPRTQALVAGFETFRPKLDTAFIAELGLTEKRHDADAAVDVVDAELDGLVDVIASTTLVDAKQDRTRVPYVHYFGNLRPSELKRPILGDQLDEMRNWPVSLQASGNPVLQQCGAQLEAKVQQADLLTAEQGKAHQAVADFRAIGGRKVLVDEFNARRKALYGQLGTIQHENPELGNGWADFFFRQGSGGDRLTTKEVDRRIAATENELAALKAQREAILNQDELAAKAKAAQEKAKKQAELEAAKKAAAALAAKMAELEQELSTE